MEVIQTVYIAHPYIQSVYRGDTDSYISGIYGDYCLFWQLSYVPMPCQELKVRHIRNILYKYGLSLSCLVTTAYTTSIFSIETFIQIVKTRN